MKLKTLRIRGFKNVRECDLTFSDSPLLTAIIGSNSSGKSNLIEAILHILIGFYFKKPPPFDFRFEFDAQGRNVALSSEDGRATIEVDGVQMTLKRFADRLREGPAQVFYPELTFVYYSGECPRVRQQIQRYDRHFRKLTQDPETDRFRPLFVQSSNEQSQLILLALFAHGHDEFLKHFGLEQITDVTVVLRSPASFDPRLHEPKLWNTAGAVRRIVAAIDETASGQDSRREERVEVARERERVTDVPARRSDTPEYSETRVYQFADDDSRRLRDLANRLTRGGDNVYLAFASLRARGILKSVEFLLKGRNAAEPFVFEQLSEGEKQLIAVVGAITLTNQSDNLVLLDEPDTHLNPQWIWDYPSMLANAFDENQTERSTVLMATHDPVMISGMVRDQVLLARAAGGDGPMFAHPVRNPRGQGVANLLCSSEFFGLPSSLDKETQELLDERLKLSIKPQLTDRDKARLRTLNKQLEIIMPGVSERDPDYVAFLRERDGRDEP